MLFSIRRFLSDSVVVNSIMNSASTHHIHARGVVLLEAVVAIGILGLLVSSVLSLSSRSVQAMYMASDEVVATYLALDASEWIRARKAYNEVNGNDWLQDIGYGMSCVPSTPCGVSTMYELSDSNGTFSSCSALDDCALSLSGISYIHNSAGTPTYFKRRILVDPVDLDSTAAGDEQAIYTITVSWRGSAGNEYSKTMYTTLYREIE